MAKPLATGENLVFSVYYQSDGRLPQTIDIYDDKGKVGMVLRDDGRAPDKVSGDRKYAGYMKEDIAKLVVAISKAESILKAKKVFPVFIGHAGSAMKYEDLVLFDQRSFASNKETEVTIHLKDAESCAADLHREKSLFIMDLAVVEDHARTYNLITGVGDPTGAWTFGTLLANMENGTHVDGVRGFLKSWVRQWVTQQSINGYVVPSRDFVMENLIEPWLTKANPGAIGPVNSATWEGIWDNTPIDNIRNYAPFKLTAIVNRIDLRGNTV